MEKMKYLFFDLDGTLTDSQEGIIKSFKHALDLNGTPHEGKDMNAVIGPPLIHSFTKFFGLCDKDADQCIKIYRQRYEKVGMLAENKLYDGVPQMLTALGAAGFELCVVTSKPENYALKVVDHFDIARHFSHIFGADAGRAEKLEVLTHAMQTTGAAASDFIMIGDRKYDLGAALDVGARSIGALYGYGSREEFLQFSPIYMAKSVPDLCEFLLSNFHA